MKARNKVGLVCLFVVLGFLVTQVRFDLSQLTAFLNEETMRLILVALVVVVGVQSVALYLLSKRPNSQEILTGYHDKSSSASQTSERGRGRPRKACSLALTGILPCPLEPNLELDPQFVERLSMAVSDYQHNRLTDVQTKPNLDGEPAHAQEERVEEKTAEGGKKIEEKRSDDKPEKDDENFGRLMVTILERKHKASEKKAPEKKGEAK